MFSTTRASPGQAASARSRVSISLLAVSVHLRAAGGADPRGGGESPRLPLRALWRGGAGVPALRPRAALLRSVVRERDAA